MTPHKWADVIKAWADGAVIHYRQWKRVGVNEGWGAWQILASNMPPVRTDAFIEYRIQPEGFKHPNQTVKEAFLAGRQVEFRSDDCDSWKLVDDWLVDWCQQRDGDHNFRSLWDRDWLQFRIRPN